MLATVREYALERLSASGDEELARRAHAAYCMVLAEEGNPRLSIEAREEWLSRCDLERDNHRAAFDWLVAVGQAEWAARLGLALFGYWERREQLDEGRQRLLSILAMPVPVPPRQRARIMSFAAALSHNRGDYAAGLALHRQALQIFRTVGDKVGEAAELNSLAAHARITGDYEEARIYCEQTLELCRALGGEPETAAALSNLADVVSRLGDHTAARRLIDEALVIFERQGDEAGVCQSISYLADFARRSGDSAEARQLHQRALDGFAGIGDAWGVARSAEDLAQLTAAGGDRQTAYRLFTRALAIFHQLDHRRGIGRVLEGLALLAQEELEFERALTLAGAAFAIRRTFGVPPRPAERTAFERALAPTWRSCPARAAQTAWTAGTIMSVDQAVGFASRSAGRPQDEKFTGSRMRRTAATRSTGTFASRPCSRMSRSSGEK
jgi:tetratricopeptide (TPR) repeat protein